MFNTNCYKIGITPTFIVSIGNLRNHTKHTSEQKRKHCNALGCKNYLNTEHAMCLLTGKRSERLEKNTQLGGGGGGDDNDDGG